MKTDIRIVIADDHPIVRQGLRQTIEQDPRMRVLAEAGDGERALERIRALTPDVAVLDIDMPRLDGFGVARAIRDERLPVEVIFLTIHRDEEIFDEAVSLGAKGYVLKDSTVSDIVAGIEAVAEGRHYISPALAGHLIALRGRSAALASEKPGLKDLTPAERRILRLIAEYKTTREIADELCVSPRTVDTHRTNICTKLEIHGSHALTKFALAHKSELS